MGTSIIPDIFLEPDPLVPPVITTGAAYDLVHERFDLATTYATTLWNTAQNLLNDLANITFDVDWDPVALEPSPMFGLDGLTLAAPTAPDLNDITIADPGFPYTAPDPVEAAIPTRTAPDYNVTDPGFAIPEPPDVTWPTFSGTAPYPSDPVLPEAPAFSLPPVPVLSSVSIPSPPEYSIPEFNWDLPTEDLTAPEPQFVYNEAEYSSAIRDQLATKLLHDLISGGSGLDEATEQAIYDRATSRQRDEEQTAYDRTLSLFAEQGYFIPPGALSAQLLEIENKILQVREDLNNDILIQQSKLAQENTHFIINAAILNEKNLMDYINQFQNRALEAAKFVVLSALEVFKVKVEKYKAQLAVYQAQAQVYTARIQGEIAKAEFYKAQIEGIKASVQVQVMLVEAYRAQIQGIMTLIELYKAEMEGAKIQAEIDQIRVQSFAATVQAYAAQAAIATERYKGYQAQIAGEVAKAEMYKAQVQAYGERVRAYGVEVEADTTVLKQQIAINENAVEIFKARLQEYMTRVQAAVAQAEIQAKNEGLRIDAFKAETNEYAAELDAVAKAYTARVEEAKASAEIELKEADVIVREALARQELIQGNIRAAAQIASQMAAAAIAGVNASANVGYTEGRQDSRSYSGQRIAAANKQNTIAIEHIYHYSD